MLLRHSTKDERHRGDYKKFSNQVVAKDRTGKEIGVVFATASPCNTPREMEELIHWANKSIEENSLHPLLLIAVFIAVFLAIHPFPDGNDGRLSRILTTLMLLRAGYSYVPYASLESVVEDNKDLYYKALRRTQTTLKSDNPDWEPWLGFFLRCLKKQKNNLSIKVEKEKILNDSSLPMLSIQVLELLRKHERLNISEMVKHTATNQSTLKVRLRELVQSNRIQRHGKGRATWYTVQN